MSPCQLNLNLNFFYVTLREILSSNQEKHNLNTTFSDVTSRCVPLIARKGAFLEAHRHCYRTTVVYGCFAAFIGPAWLGRKAG